LKSGTCLAKHSCGAKPLNETEFIMGNQERSNPQNRPSQQPGEQRSGSGDRTNPQRTGEQRDKDGNPQRDSGDRGGGNNPQRSNPQRDEEHDAE
jgi:hypothetical protein